MPLSVSRPSRNCLRRLQPVRGACEEWSARGCRFGPSARFHPAIAFDRARGKVVLYGWIQHHHESGTARRLGIGRHIMAAVQFLRIDRHHVARRCLRREDERTVAVLAYGYSVRHAPVERDRAHRGRCGHTALCARMAAVLHVRFQSGRRPVLCAHVGSHRVDDRSPDRRWDGAAWTRVTGTQPSIRLNAAMAYDRDRNRVVLYGGDVETGTPDLADT